MNDKWPYGESTEIDVLCTISMDLPLLSWVSPKLSPEDFNNVLIGEVWAVIRRLWYDYRKLPTIKQIAVEVELLFKEGIFEDDDVTVIRDILKMLADPEGVPDTWTKDKIEKWLRSRDYQSFVHSSSQALATGELGSIDEEYRKLVMSAPIDEIKEDFFDRLEDISAYSKRKSLNLISTGIKELDYILSGGLARTEFGMVFGPDGLGKSFMLNQIGQSCVLSGLRVLHITNELPSADVEVRYLSGFTSIPQDEFSERIEEIRQLSDHLKANRGLLTVKYIPPSSKPELVWNELEQARHNGEPYDVVLIDYLDRFRANDDTKNQWQDLTEVCDQFSYMAKPENDGGFNCLIVAVTHADASAYNKQSIGAGQMGLSKMGKNKTADYILGMSGNEDDKEKGLIRVTTIKLRYRPWPKKNRAVLKGAFDRSTFIPVQLEVTEVNK